MNLTIYYRHTPASRSFGKSRPAWFNHEICFANLLQSILKHGDRDTIRLEVLLDDQITGFGIRSNNTVTRERRTLRARFKLIDASSQAVLVDATAQSDAGIDVVTSEYAVIAAEQTALENISNDVADQIVSRVALYARRHPLSE